MQKVMLIEDDPTMLSLLQAFLQIEGYEVVGLAQDDRLDEIMNTLEREKPDLVLIDVHLNQFSGIDLLHSIRNKADLKPVRVIMCSGMDLGMKCYEEGADGFILKPYMPEDLIKVIQQTLED